MAITVDERDNDVRVGRTSNGVVGVVLPLSLAPSGLGVSSGLTERSTV